MVKIDPVRPIAAGVQPGAVDRMKELNAALTDLFAKITDPELKKNVEDLAKINSLDVMIEALQVCAQKGDKQAKDFWKDIKILLIRLN